MWFERCLEQTKLRSEADSGCSQTSEQPNRFFTPTISCKIQPLDKNWRCQGKKKLVIHFNNSENGRSKDAKRHPLTDSASLFFLSPQSRTVDSNQFHCRVEISLWKSGTLSINFRVTPNIDLATFQRFLHSTVSPT
jgi:hypothetical protein